MASSTAIRELEHDFENKANDLSKLQKELDLVNEGANVYKLNVPVLVKQDWAEADANVPKRIDSISLELKRLDVTVQDLEAKQNSKNDEDVLVYY
ncbi:hypothetical protein MANES_09G021201v8 [Manihot esculenta]|uniref:Uncharacterized protein n=1 Tax=Manihot esculenta TaxID=3983 RepID=A0ACB7H2Q3_MANES|nr:hypothetical protein MANES_09G021201v8 [Manihot esculenta]